MNFEVQNALAALEKRTPDFYIVEALSEPDPKLKDNARKALMELGTDKTASQRLREMLRLY